MGIRQKERYKYFIIAYEDIINQFILGGGEPSFLIIWRTKSFKN